jgi:hypothetical protein
MDAMKSISTQLLTLMICLELVLAPFPKVAMAKEEPVAKPKSIYPDIASPDAYLRVVQAEAESLFDPKTGCAQLGDNGEVRVINQTTQGAIHGDPEAKTSIDCGARVEAFGEAWKKAQQLEKDFDKADKSKKTNGACDNCVIEKKVLNSDFLVPKEGLCSLKEKKQIAADYKDPKKNCGWGSNASVVGCIKDIMDTFLTSTAAMLHTGVELAMSGVKATNNFLFGANKPPEKLATQKSLVLSGMDAETIKKAQENGEKATRGTTEKIFDKIGSFVEFIGVDYPAYKEQFLCAKCGDRVNAICKMVGLLGKDVVKNSLIIWMTGKPLMVVAEDTVAGRAFVAWGKEKFASVGAKAVASWAKFKTATPLGAKLAAAPVKLIGHIFRTADDVMMAPTKLFIKGGSEVAMDGAAMEERSALLSGVDSLKPGEALKTAEGEAVGKATTSKVSSSGNNLEVETKTAITENMRIARDKTKKLPHFMRGEKVNFDMTGIENTSSAKFRVTGAAVKAQTAHGQQYFRIGSHPEEVKAVFPFGPEGKSALIRMKDDSLILAQDGRAASYVKKEDAKIFDAFLGSEKQKADQALLKETAATGKVNGQEMTEQISTPVEGKEGEVVETMKTGPECGSKTITISAGRAFN